MDVSSDPGGLMAFSTGTATNEADLLIDWFNFLQANGWTADVDYTVDDQSPNYGVVQRKVNESPTTENSVNLHCGFAPIQAGGSDGPGFNMIPMRDYAFGAPQTGTDVATSNGDYDAVSGARHIRTNFPSDPYDGYWFFADNYYAHAVVEYATGFFRHFGMGQLQKVGKWIGGEYYYGHFWDQSASVVDAPLASQHTVGLDAAINASSADCAVMYGVRMDGQSCLYTGLDGRQSPVSNFSRWYAFGETPESGSGNSTDSAGRDRGGLMGNGPRFGFHYPLYESGVIPYNGYRPMHPISVFTNYDAGSQNDSILLGYQPDVRSIVMQGDLQPGDQFTIGADTWIAFPVVRRTEELNNDDLEKSGYLGIAYKIVS
jgi:hypothetical protein